MVNTPQDINIPEEPEYDAYGAPLNASPEDFGIPPYEQPPQGMPRHDSFAATADKPHKYLPANRTWLWWVPWRQQNHRAVADTLSRRANHAPPHSIEAEQAVLGVLMREANEAFDKVSDTVTEGDFYQLNHKLIYRAISALAMAGSKPDVVTVNSWLQTRGESEDAGGLNYIGALAEVAPSAGKYQGIRRNRP